MTKKDQSTKEQQANELFAWVETVDEVMEDWDGKGILTIEIPKDEEESQT